MTPFCCLACGSNRRMNADSSALKLCCGKCSSLGTYLSHLAVALSGVGVSSYCILQAAVVEGKVAVFWISQLFCTDLKAELQSFRNIKMMVTQLLFLIFLSGFFEDALHGRASYTCATILQTLAQFSNEWAKRILFRHHPCKGMRIIQFFCLTREAENSSLIHNFSFLLSKGKIDYKPEL